MAAKIRVVGASGSHRPPNRDQPPGSRKIDQAQHLSTQLEGDGNTLEFIGATLLCVDIRNAAGLAKLLAEPFKTQLPVAV